MSRSFTWDDVYRCVELTGDNNPIYLDEDFVRRGTRFDRPVIQGLLTEGLVTSIVSRHLPGPGAILLHKEIVFSHPVYVGDTITALVEVIDVDFQRHWLTEQVICSNQDNKEVLRGKLVLSVEKRRLG